MGTPVNERVKLSDNVHEALAAGRPVVALESSLIAHGLPRPLNEQTARAAEEAVCRVGAVPATIAICEGVPTVGVSGREIGRLASGDQVVKAGRRDLGWVIARRCWAGTTVSATLALAHHAGLTVFATGGIGGVHQGVLDSFDVSADLAELARTPILVVCSGVKSILDVPRTLELLETLAVPVIGYQTDEFPEFVCRGRGLPVSCRVENAFEAADIFAVHRAWRGGGMLLVQPAPAELLVDPGEMTAALTEADDEVRRRGLRGGAVTPFLLQRLAERTQGRSLEANRALIIANAKLAAQVAMALSGSGGGGYCLEPTRTGL